MTATVVWLTNSVAVATWATLAAGLAALVAATIRSSPSSPPRRRVEQATPGRCAASPDAARPGATRQNHDRPGAASTGPVNNH